MKIVIIGGSGLIGSKLANNLLLMGHEVVAAAPSTGVNTITGEGLTTALANAQVVVDVANSPSFEDKAVLEFFEKSGRNLLAAEAAAGVQHHIALSVVGTERLLDSGYFRAKMAQEQLIKQATIPYTIVRATQFFEFLGSIAYGATEGQTVRLSTAPMQPIAAEDVALLLAKVVTEAPINGMIEIAGPEKAGIADMVQRYLNKNGDARTVLADANATYFGTAVNEQSLVPGTNAQLGSITLDTWYNNQPHKAATAH